MGDTDVELMGNMVMSGFEPATQWSAQYPGWTKTPYFMRYDPIF